MKDQFVTYEIAKKLKELGFNEPCIGYYGKDQYLNIEQVNSSKEWEFYKDQHADCLAPLWQQAIDWLRNKYGWQLCYNRLPHSYHYQIYFKDEVTNKQLTEGVTGKNGLYYEGLEAAILKALELVSK